MKQVNDPQGNIITYLGLGPEAGPLPAFFYFALSAEESLQLAPYNSAATLLEKAPLRIFSLSIPGHGPEFDKFHAMQYWADECKKGTDLLDSFFEKTLFSLNWLIEEGWIDREHIGVGGLSRGAFIATHLAAREKRIKTVLGFAPLTSLLELKEFAFLENHDTLVPHVYKLDRLVEKLLHIKSLRFYIGNRDKRVGTDVCYDFIRKLADCAHLHRRRKMEIELYITPSIGFKGHGTAPETFEKGADWMKKKLLEDV